MTSDTLRLFLELLNQVSVRPMQPDAEKVWARVMAAKTEVCQELGIPLYGEKAQSSVDV